MNSSDSSSQTPNVWTAFCLKARNPPKKGVFRIKNKNEFLSCSGYLKDYQKKPWDAYQFFLKGFGTACKKPPFFPQKACCFSTTTGSNSKLLIFTAGTKIIPTSIRILSRCDKKRLANFMEEFH